jgi:hypothetical protein
VLRTKYDYIFKIKILEFYFGIHLSKLIYYVKKTIYILIGGAVVIIAGLIILSKSDVIGNKDKGTEIEIAQVNQ